MRRRRLLPAVLALAGALAPALAAGQAGAPPPESALAELILLEDGRQYEPGAFGRLLGDPNPRVRSRAALAAGRIRDPRALPALMRLLADGDSSVAATAAFALGQLGDTAAAPALIARLDPRRLRTSPTVVAEAAAALGKLRTPAARESLENLLRAAPSAGPGVREAVGAALLALWRYPRPADVAPILPWLASSDTALSWRAAYALSRRADPAGTAALAERVEHPAALVRSFAVRALTAPLADSSGLGRERALGLLRDALHDAEPAVRVNAARALGTYPEAAALGELRRLLTGSDPHLAITAAESLGRVGAAAAAAAEELTAVSRDPRWEIARRTAAVAALARVSPPRAGPVVADLARAAEWRARAAAARAAAELRDWTAARSLARDADARVAAAAVEAAVTTLRDSVWLVRPLLTEALGHPDVMVRAGALGGFERLADPADVPLVLDAYARAALDTVLNDAALAAVQAAGAIARRNQGAAARAFLARFRRSGDYLVRRAAAAAFGDSAVLAAWGPPLPVEGALDPARAAELARRIAAGGQASARIVTDRGVVSLQLFLQEAPLTVINFASLARRGFFDGQEWPRVVANFVVQGGDPRGDTSGGPGHAIRDEINRVPYRTGTLGMALSGPDTGGSQWFVTHSPQPHLDGTYTVFGRVSAGMEVVHQVLVGDRIQQIEILGGW